MGRCPNQEKAKERIKGGTKGQAREGIGQYCGKVWKRRKRADKGKEEWEEVGEQKVIRACSGGQD